MANKGPRKNIHMVSTGKNEKGKPTKTVYATRRNPRNDLSNTKLKLKKFDRRAFNPETGKIGMICEFVEKNPPK